MKILLKIIRWIVGRLILFVNTLTQPKKAVREPVEQEQVNQEGKKLSLYQFKACPFCVKVRRAMVRLNVPIICKDVKGDCQVQEELLRGGGKVKTPCLRIEQEDGSIQWMYESSDIVAYLEKRFS